MPEKHLIGNIHINDDSIIGCSKKYGVSALVRNRSGQGMTLPIDQITPDDLRYLADFLEKQQEKMAKESQF